MIFFASYIVAVWLILLENFGETAIVVTLKGVSDKFSELLSSACNRFGPNYSSSVRQQAAKQTSQRDHEPKLGASSLDIEMSPRYSASNASGPEPPASPDGDTASVAGDSKTEG